VERGWQVGDRFVGTLLGPEGTGRPARWGWALVLLVQAVLFLVPLVHLWVCRVWRGRVDGSGWSLRTAQWTRASSDSD
jgi:hypothetical protein